MSSEVLPPGEGSTIWGSSPRVLGESKVFPLGEGPTPLPTMPFSDTVKSMRLRYVAEKLIAHCVRIS